MTSEPRPAYGQDELVGITVESDDELNGALSAAAAAAGPGNLGFPIGLLFVEAAKRFATFGDCRPWRMCAGRMSDKTAGRNGYLARVRGFALRHAETTGLFGRGGEFRRHLGMTIRQRQPKETADQYSSDEQKEMTRAHGADGSTVSSLAATDTTA